MLILKKFPLKKLLLLFLSIAFTLIFFEIGVRFSPLRQNAFETKSSIFDNSFEDLPKGLIYLPRKNVRPQRITNPIENFSFTVQTNGLGLFQTNEYVDSPAPIGYILGDSFTAGSMANIDENYSYQLQKKMPRIQWLNLSVYGYGTIDEAIRMEAFDKEFRQKTGKSPDLLLLHFWLGNDFIDNASYKKGRNTNSAVFRLKNYLLRTSRVYELLRQIRDQIKNASATHNTKTPALQNYESFIEPYVSNLDKEPTIEALQRINNYCRAQRIKLIVVLIPTREMASKKLRIKYETKFRGKIRFDLLRNHMKTLLSSMSVPYVDLADVFLKQNDGEKYFFQFDPHWNKDGQELAAEYVVKEFHTKINP